MKFGAQLANYSTTWEDTLSTIKVIESGPWHSLWFSDHFLIPLPGANLDHLPALESWSMITATAVVTNRLRLGILVTGNTYRNPALLAKMAATVDQISNGRLILGIGAGWYKREHEAFGWEFPDVRERCDRLEEAVELIKKLFTAEGSVDYNGRYYKLDKAHFAPACIQKPHVPIMVGGNGEKRTLRTLAKFGDICNIDFNNPGSPELFKHKLEVLECHCEEIGRDPAEIEKTMLIPLRLESDEKKAAQIRKARGEWVLYGTASFIIDRIQQYIDAGVEEIMFGSIPMKPELFEQINEEILSAFNK
ncbi:MAG: TIGR03560 family F420-dependent LLM class oxidoreductase [Candidatus Lokiarchaeota archaeon]|nr:TIGR03560 family F420-dependent LLM class oxidoreductase [Candidatus Lokiarchaeota archaeon]